MFWYVCGLSLGLQGLLYVGKRSGFPVAMLNSEDVVSRLVIGFQAWATEYRIYESTYPKPQNSPKASYSMVFGPTNLIF